MRKNTKRRKFTMRAFNPDCVIGIGNSGRCDDGLGWAFLDALKEARYKRSSLVYRYQLQVEDAELISHFERVLFVDSTVEALKQGFAVSELKPLLNTQFSTHSLDPATILGLCKELYDDYPAAVELRISGERWELETGLSVTGKRNLDKATKEIIGKPFGHMS